MQQDRQQDDAVRGAEGSSGQVGGRGEALYVRPMPGGGTVRVELVAEQRDDRTRVRRRGRLVLEGRDPARGARAEPLVVEELEGEDERAIVDALFRIARDNAAIARRLLRRRGPAPRAD